MGSYCITRGAGSGSLWQPRGVGCSWSWGGRIKMEGTYVHLWLIHVVVWQTPTQYCKAIILQLKILFYKVGEGRNLCAIFKLDCKQLQRLCPQHPRGKSCPPHTGLGDGQPLHIWSVTQILVLLLLVSLKLRPPSSSAETCLGRQGE